MEIVKQKSVEATVKAWEDQQEKRESQMSCCCYSGD